MSACPICSWTDGFHDRGVHDERLVPPELVYRKHRIPGQDGVWMRLDGELLPHLREGAAGEDEAPYTP